MTERRMAQPDWCARHPAAHIRWEVLRDEPYLRRRDSDRRVDDCGRLRNPSDSESRDKARAAQAEAIHDPECNALRGRTVSDLADNSCARPAVPDHHRA